MSRTTRLCLFVWSLTAVLALATLVAPMIPDVSAQQGARTVNVLVGGGQDTMQALAYFPQQLRIRQGDTVSWRITVDEIHTVSFTRGFDFGPGSVQSPLEPPGTMIPGLAAAGTGDALVMNPQILWPTRAPGAPVERHTGVGFNSSGVMTRQSPAPGVPANDTFQLSFTTTGTYMYMCLVHPDRMYGTVEVLPSSSTDVPSQALIDAQAAREQGVMMGLLQAARTQGDGPVRREPAADGSTIHYVRAGNQEWMSGEGRAQFMDFQPKNLTINTGDTVVWSSPFFHSVTFTPVPPFPEFLLLRPEPSGPPVVEINPLIWMPAKPSAVYDPTQYYNSGILGPFAPFGDSWALTFRTPGTYEYSCQVHEQLGMKGTITVQ